MYYQHKRDNSKKKKKGNRLDSVDPEEVRCIKGHHSASSQMYFLLYFSFIVHFFSTFKLKYFPFFNAIFYFFSHHFLWYHKYHLQKEIYHLKKPYHTDYIDMIFLSNVDS